MAKRILVVDDEGDFTELVQFRFQDSGYEFDFAAAGIEALNKARRTLPDLILLDLLLPDLDGLTMCEMLRRLPSTRGTPIIMISALSSDVTKFSARVAGVDQFFSKPVNFGELKASVEKLLAAPSTYTDES